MANSSPYMITTAGLVLLLGIVLLYAFTCRRRQRGPSESFYPVYVPEYGEFNEACRWDARRHCNRADGSEGECVMNGICLPSLLNFVD